MGLHGSCPCKVCMLVAAHGLQSAPACPACIPGTTSAAAVSPSPPPAGLLVPDAPPEQLPWLQRAAAAHGLEHVLVVSPATPPADMQRLARSSQGFIYLASVAGAQHKHTAGPVLMLGRGSAKHGEQRSPPALLPLAPQAQQACGRASIHKWSGSSSSCMRGPIHPFVWALACLVPTRRVGGAGGGRAAAGTACVAAGCK